MTAQPIAPSRGRRSRQLHDLDRFRPLIAEALIAFRTDPTYAESMCRRAVIIQNKQARWRTRLLLRQLFNLDGNPIVTGWPLEGLADWLDTWPPQRVSANAVGVDMDQMRKVGLRGVGDERDRQVEA